MKGSQNHFVSNIKYGKSLTNTKCLTSTKKTDTRCKVGKKSHEYHKKYIYQQKYAASKISTIYLNILTITTPLGVPFVHACDPEDCTNTWRHGAPVECALPGTRTVVVATSPL
jgi:hypothetical protein